MKCFTTIREQSTKVLKVSPNIHYVKLLFSQLGSARFIIQPIQNQQTSVCHQPRPSARLKTLIPTLIITDIPKKIVCYSLHASLPYLQSLINAFFLCGFSFQRSLQFL